MCIKYFCDFCGFFLVIEYLKWFYDKMDNDVENVEENEKYLFFFVLVIRNEDLE